MIFSDDLFAKWLQNEIKSNYDIDKRKFKKRGYLHFDKRIWLPSKAVQDHIKTFLASSEKVASHKFLPFLKVTIESVKYKKGPDPKNPTKTKWIKKKKKRPICYAAHKDSLIYSFYAFGLSQLYENYLVRTGLTDVVLAYRKYEEKKSNISFAYEAFEEIAKRGECTVIALDISKFFDTIDHALLKSAWKKVIGTKLPDDQYAVFRSVTKYSYCHQLKVYKHFGIQKRTLRKGGANALKSICPTYEFRILREAGLILQNPPFRLGDCKFLENVGIPQGSPISALLANIYMLDFDEEALQLSKVLNFSYRRYSDDILVVCDTKDYKEIEQLFYALIKKVKLSIQPAKTDITHFGIDSKGMLRGFKKEFPTEALRLSESEGNIYKTAQYLGFEFTGQGVYIRASSMAKFYRKLKSAAFRSVLTAYSKRGKGDVIFRRSLYRKHTYLYQHLYKRNERKSNFLTYAYNARSHGDTVVGTLGEDKIKAQVSGHVDKLQQKVVKFALKRESQIPVNKRQTKIPLKWLASKRPSIKNDLSLKKADQALKISEAIPKIMSKLNLGTASPGAIMTELISQKLFKRDYGKGQPLRKLLTELEKTDNLHLIPWVISEAKGTKRYWIIRAPTYPKL